MIYGSSDDFTNPTDTKKIRVLLADDHPLIREALRNTLERALDIVIVGEADDGAKAVELALQLVPDVVIMDIMMPKLNGLEAMRQIKATHPNIAVLVLTIHGDRDHIFGILNAGAAGYLTKTAFGEEVVQAVRAVAMGGTVLSHEVREQIMSHASHFISKPSTYRGTGLLTNREHQILKLIAKGLSNKEIADCLGLTTNTVKHYLVELFSKLNVGSRTEAVISGLQSGYLNMDDLMH